jgi:hypothetical protein
MTAGGIAGAGALKTASRIVRVIAVFCALSAGSAMAADPSEYSEAERQLFVRPHLDSVQLPARLHYRYERTGTLQPAVSDHATLILSETAGNRTAAVEYLSEDRKLELPPAGFAEGNPVILYFFEREVRELKRLTGGAVGFYRNRIRKALAGEATLRETQVSYNGKQVKGVEIRIDPYVNDPARSRFEKFADRYYVMVLSPDIPGEVYQLKAVLQGKAAGSGQEETVQGEVLTFERQDNGQ